MTVSRKIGLGAATAALLITTATPAYAGWSTGLGWGRGPVYGGMNWGGGGRRHGRGDNDTAEVLGGVILGAILVSAIGSAKKNKQARRDRTDDYPDRDDRVARDDDRDYDRNGDRNSQRRGSIGNEDQAVDACAAAAEDKAGRTSSVREVDRVNSSKDGWDVEGVVESRENWRDSTGDRRRFTCSVRYGAVDSVYVEDDKVAYAD